jgi:hypothetical protein
MIGAGVLDDHAATQAFRAAQRNGTDDAVTQLLLHFQGQFGAFHFQCVVHLRHGVAREFHVNHGADTLNDFAISHVRSFRYSFNFVTRGRLR